MKKRFVSIVLTAVMLLGLAPVLSIDANAATLTVTSSSDKRIDYMLNNISYQNFSGSTINGGKVNSAQVIDYIKHFMFNSRFAAINGGTFNYPNSGSYAREVTDGTYTRSIRGSTGCCAYCYFVSKVIYGVDWFDSAQQTRLRSASELKNFLLTYGQAGEHLRADPSHSVTFISGDEDGFYCFSYCGDNNPVIHLDYWTYDAFYAKYGGYSIYVYDIFKADNTSTMSCKNGHSYNSNVLTAPTKTSTGTLRCYCPVCRNTMDVTLPKLNSTEYTVKTEGTTTCTAGAVEHYTWKITEYGTFTFDVQLASGSHTYTYSLSAAPTESAEGSIKGVCSKCGNTTYVSVPKLNLTDYDYVVIGEPTCTSGCTGRYMWKNTKYGSYHFDKEFSPLGHAYFEPELNEVIAEPTATSEGQLVCHCFRCGDTLTLTLPKFSADEYNYTINEYPTRYKSGSATYTWLVEEYGDYSFSVELPMLKSGDNPFVDVNSSDVYYDAILWAYYHDPQQITGGTDATHFAPGNACTRGQVVTFLWRAAGNPEPTGDTSMFKDSASIASAYKKAVAWAVEKGITTGFSDGTFRPNEPVTRAQFVTFLWRADNKPSTNGSISGFKDASSVAGAYKEAIAWAVEKGITTGYSDGTFRPNATCTRWAVVLFMYRDR